MAKNREIDDAVVMLKSSNDCSTMKLKQESKSSLKRKTLERRELQRISELPKYFNPYKCRGS
jgi:hypothetical protein